MLRLHTGLVPVLAALLFSCGSGAEADRSLADSASAARAAEVTRAAAAEIATSGPATITQAASVSTAPAPAVSAEPAQDVIDTADTADASTDPQYSGDRNSRFCELVRQLDESSPLDSVFGQSTTPEATKASWDQVMAVFGPLRETAPDEIANDVGVATRFIDVMDRIFVENKYNIDEVAIAMEAEPELAELSNGDSEMDAATERLDAYGVDVCGLAP